MIYQNSVHCDKCSNAEEFDHRSFREVIADIKEDGWKISKVGDVWVHHCPDCVDKNQPQHWWNNE